MSSLGFKLNQEGTEQVFDHDKDGKPIPLYNPLTGKHDIKFTAKKALLPHADAGEHLGDGAVPAQQLASGSTTPIRRWPAAWLPTRTG